MREDALASLLVRRGVVCAFVQHFALGSQAVFAPLLLNVDQRPLTRAKAKVLNARNGEEVLLAIFRYPMISTVTPCGISLCSTLTR